MDFTKLYRWLAALVLSGLIAGGGVGVNASPSASGIKPGVQTTQNGLSLTWTSPELVFITDQEGKVRFYMPGFEQLEKPGVPFVPVASELIALPPGANPQIYIEIIEDSTLPLPEQFALAPIPEGVVKSPDGDVIGGNFKSTNAALTFAPNPIEIENLGVMRGINLARVTFYPVRPVGDELRLTSFIQARIDFNTPIARASGPTTPLDPLQESLVSKVINPGHLQTAARAATQTAANTLGSQAVSGTAIIEVKHRGLYEITYQDLNAAGFPVNSVNTNNLTLYRSGAKVGDPLEKVAVDWEGNGDQTFESWERILFYAEPRFSRWTEFDTYLLKEENEAGKRMVNRPANPSAPLGRAFSELLEEQNLIYTPDCYCASIPAGRGGDHWAWDEIKIPYGGSVSKTYNFQISNVDTAQAGNVTVWLLGFTDLVDNPDHKVQISINNHQLSPAITWDGKLSIEKELTIPASVLNTGSNTLKIRIPGIVDIEGIYLDAYQIRYTLDGDIISGPIYFTGEDSQHSYHVKFRNADEPGFIPLDVTNPKNPKWMAGLTIQGDNITLGDPTNSAKKHAYFLTTISNISSPSSIRLQRPVNFANGDYIVISHHNFLEAVSPLVSLRQGQGHTVSVVDVRTIYDNYGFGKPVPEAITAFLEDAYHHWSIQPLYVLLVGDGTSDPRGYLTGSFETFIPPYLADVDPWAGETAADNRFVTVDPPDDVEDILPDMLIGRLPVNSIGELNLIIDKIIDYETNPPPGDWGKTITIVTDDADSPGSPVNNFPEDANYLEDNLIPDGYIVNKIIYPPASEPDQTRTAIRNQWNAGSAIMTYIGHGAIKGGGKTFEGFWLAKDLDSLSNGPKQSFVFEMTCLTGKFQSFEDHSFDELALLKNNNAAIAAWGGTGLGIATGHVQLAEGFYGSLFNGFGADLGLATQAGKVDLLTNKPGYKDLVDTYVLFGDPATRLQMPHYGGRKTALPLVYKQ